MFQRNNFEPLQFTVTSVLPSAHLIGTRPLPQPIGNGQFEMIILKTFKFPRSTCACGQLTNGAL